MAGLNTIADLLAWFGWYVIPFIVILSLIVAVHELGHYFVGRWCGVKIDAFSLGFGHELFARVDSRGTRWRIGALPLGGYVKFHGDANASSVGGANGDPAVDRSLTLAGQPLRNRAAIVLAGPVANFILAFVIFTGMFMAFGRIEHVARIGRVEAGSPAAAAGFQAGDLIKSINGNPIDSFETLQELTLMSTGLPMNFVVVRQGQSLDLTATPRITVVDQGVFGKRRMGHLGLGLVQRPERRQGRTVRPHDLRGMGRGAGMVHRQGDWRLCGRDFRRTGIDRSDVGVDRRRANGGRDGENQPLGVVQPCRVVLGFGGPNEFAADSAAGRWPSRILRIRGPAWTPLKRAGAGNWPSNSESRWSHY